jgi:hypothetical protein
MAIKGWDREKEFAKKVGKSERTLRSWRVGTYGDDVKHGGIYVYSIRRAGGRVATLALRRAGNQAAIIQIRGPCNAQPPKEIIGVAQRWLRAQAPLPQPPQQAPDAFAKWLSRQPNQKADERLDGEDIPF